MENIKTCPNCKSCEDCPYFEKVHIKSAGLRIYRNFICKQSVNNHTEQTESYIICNTKNIDVHSEKLISKLEQYKKCPRCKYILDHAEKLLRNIPKINKLDVLGICDKCWMKDRNRYSACACSEAIEKFFAIKKQKDKEFTESNEIKYKLQKVTNPLTGKYEREPQIGQSNKTKKYLQQKIRISETSRDRSIFNTNLRYPLCRISTSQESLTEKYLDLPPTHLKKAAAFNHDKEPSILDLIAEHNRNRNEYSKNVILEFKPIDAQLKVNHNGEEYIKNKESRKRSNSAISLPSAKTLSDAFPFVYLSKEKEILHKDFSYFFMKGAEKTKQTIQKLKSSSELIKDTQDMLRAREEKLERKNEENLRQKVFDQGKSKKSFTKTMPKVDLLTIKEIKKVRGDVGEQEKEISGQEKLYEKVKPMRGKDEKSRKETETVERRTKESSRKDKETRKKNEEELESEKKNIITREQEKIDKSSSDKQKLETEHAIKFKNIEKHSTKALNREEKCPYKRGKETHKKREGKEVPHDFKKAFEKENEESTKKKRLQPEKDKEMQEKGKERTMPSLHRHIGLEYRLLNQCGADSMQFEK